MEKTYTVEVTEKEHDAVFGALNFLKVKFEQGDALAMIALLKFGSGIVSYTEKSTHLSHELGFCKDPNCTYDPSTGRFAGEKEPGPVLGLDQPRQATKKAAPKRASRKAGSSAKKA